MSTEIRRRPLRVPESFTTLVIAVGLAAAAFLYHRRADPLPPWAILLFILAPMAGFVFAAVTYLQAGGAPVMRAPRGGARGPGARAGRALDSDSAGRALDIDTDVDAADARDTRAPDSAVSAVSAVSPVSAGYAGDASDVGDVGDVSLRDTRSRLLTEMAALGRRANINLGVGGGIAIFGLGFLAYVVLKAQAPEAGAAGALQSYLPRLSLVLAIEFLAYFFLSLYRSNLAEIKYFQNEMTNVEARILALRVALRVKNDELTRDVVAQLARTERNFVIDKGSSTVDIERARLENEAAASLGKLVEAIGSLKKS